MEETIATFVLVPAHPKNAGQVQAVLKFFEWGFGRGQGIADKLDYIPMPASVVKMTEMTWHRQITANGRSLWPVD